VDNFHRAGGPVLWCHDHQRPPIGKAAATTGTHLRASVSFDQEDEFARAVESKIKRGYLGACSVGWDFVDSSGSRLDHNRHSPSWLAENSLYDLTEVSIVPIGADPLAMAERQRRALGTLGRELVQLYDDQERADSDVTADELFPAVVEWCRRHGVDLGEYADLSNVRQWGDGEDGEGTEAEPARNTRGAIPSHKNTSTDMDGAWDADAELAKADGAAQLMRMHAWRDYDGEPDAKSTYKLPHHHADGTLSWRGVAAAMGRLSQTDISDEDKAGVYRHLTAHYRQLGKDEPDLRATLSGYIRAADLELTRSATEPTNDPASAGENVPPASAGVDHQAARLVLAAFALKEK